MSKFITNLNNILYLTPWYPDRNDPMPGIFIQRHAIASSLFNNVAVLYVHSDKNCKSLFEIEYNENEFAEVKVYFKTYSGILKILFPFFFLIAHTKGLKLLKTKFNFEPDLLHVNILTREGIIALLYKILKRKNYVITEHWTRYHSGNYNGILRKIITWIVVKFASAVMPVSEHLAKSMKKCGLKNKYYKIVPNVVDTNLFKPYKKEKTNSAINIIHISCTNDEQKNISGIIKAFSEIRYKRIDFKLTIIGDAPDFPKLKKLKSELNMEDLIEFKGILPAEELAKVISNSDFHIMFSNYENLPVVNLECFACGIPVLSSDVGGIKEHLNNRLGILTPQRDITKLVLNIENMMNNLSNYDSDYIRDYAIENFSKEKIGKLLTEIYNSVLGNNSTHVYPH